MTERPTQPDGCMCTEVLRTPDEWCAETGVQILDPDGWRYDRKSWTDPITCDEFVMRAVMSTTKNTGQLFASHQGRA